MFPPPFCRQVRQEPWRHAGGGNDIIACPLAPRLVHTLTVSPLLILLQDVFSKCPARVICKHHFDSVTSMLRAFRCLQNKGQIYLAAELSLSHLALPCPSPRAVPFLLTVPPCQLHLSKPYPSCRPWLQHTPFILQTFTE